MEIYKGHMRLSEYLSGYLSGHESVLGESLGAGQVRLVVDDGRTWAVLGEKYLDVSALAECLTGLYAARGHAGEGFSKLGVEGLASYATAKSVLAKFLRTVPVATADPAQCAEWMWNSDNIGRWR